MSTRYQTTAEIRQEISRLRGLLRERKAKALGHSSNKGRTFTKGGHEYLYGVAAHFWRRLEIYRRAGGDVALIGTHGDFESIEDLQPGNCEGCAETHPVGWHEGEWHHDVKTKGGQKVRLPELRNMGLQSVPSGVSQSRHQVYAARAVHSARPSKQRKGGSMIEKYPLGWPDGWPRTLLKDREQRKAWKKTERQAIQDLEDELKRFGVISATLTRKDPQDFRSASDPSVAIYFSRRREDDFSWQAALGISNPSPSTDEIDAAFRALAKKHHTDKPGGDLEMMIALNAHREAAVAYVNRLSGVTHDLVIACDRYSETRWNIFAVSNTVYSLRQMERDGTSRLLERALTGFAAIGEKSSATAA